MMFIKSSIRIVFIAFLDIISFDLFYASSRGCFTVQNKNICYFEPVVANTHVTWDDAWNVCAENNATLPVIDDRMTTEALRRYLKSKPSVPVDMWLAGREIRTDEWRWLNGKPFGRKNSFANRDNPKSSYDTNAVITEKLQYMWRWAQRPNCYICHYNESELCQNKSIRPIPWKNGCLFVSNDETLNFMEARNRCLDGGGDLATFEEDEGLEMLGNDSSLFTKNKNYWVGLRQNLWIWNETATSKEIKYSNWADYKNELFKECLSIRLLDYKWNQDRCASEKTVLCQSVNTTSSKLTQETEVDIPSSTGSPEAGPHTGVSKDLLLIIVGSVIAVAIVVVIIVVLVVVLKIPKNSQERGITLHADEKPTVPREMSAHRNENKSVKMKSIEDSEISNHYAEIPVDYDDNDECRDDPQPGIVYAALEFDANKAIYEEPDLRSQRKQEADAPAKAGALNKNVESPTQAAVGTIYANL